MNQTHKQNIIMELPKLPNKVELLQAKMKKDKFGLEFEPIPY